MQTAQRIINYYRRNRFIVYTICALVTLLPLLSIRFISSRNLNLLRTVAFASHAACALGNELHPLLVGRNILLALLELPCATAPMRLRKQAAHLQTIRSLRLVTDGILFGSSLLAARTTPIRQPLLDLPAAGDL
ncbi:CSS-motif domain-containing protein, partial [Salmonella enterica]|uniref:CSS-motif domain-containing protein n=1 Tax=Salmonella enterica TaxID=28901 RepID=UPI001495208E